MDGKTSGVSVPTIDKAAQASCEAQLLEMGVSFERLEPISDGNGCAVPAPLKISKLSADIELKPAATLNCSMTLALANWTKESVAPAFEKAFPGQKLTAVRQASGYVCRPRNNQPGAKLSEHASGNAIDISGFERTDGTIHTVVVRQRQGTLDEAFQKAVRFAACLDFTTVLGPLSDANHADHFHLDLAQRKRGYRLCPFPEVVVEKDAPASMKSEAAEALAE